MNATGDSASRFLREVSEQAAHRLGWEPDLEESRRLAAAREFASGMLERAVAAAHDRDERALSEAAHELASSPPMLAAFYQNIDLLYYRDAFADADALSALVMRALEHSAEMRKPS